MKGSQESGNVWFVKDGANLELFEGYMQSFSEKALMKLRSTALVSHPVYTILLNILTKISQGLISNGYRLVDYYQYVAVKGNCNERE